MSTRSRQGVLCTEYRYGVIVIIDGEGRRLVEATDLVTIPDSSVLYHAPRLEVKPSLQGLVVYWEFTWTLGVSLSTGSRFASWV